MTNPVIDPSTLTEEQREAIREIFNKSESYEECENLTKIFGEDMFKEEPVCQIGDKVRKISNGNVYEVNDVYYSHFCWSYGLKGYPLMVYGDEIEIVEKGE